jgi:hypothetical protein
MRHNASNPLNRAYCGAVTFKPFKREAEPRGAAYAFPHRHSSAAPAGDSGGVLVLANEAWLAYRSSSLFRLPNRS